jgi:predicted transcriptional regulator
LNKIKGQKGAIQQFANALPLSAEQKEKLGKAIDEPTSLVPASVLAKAEDLKQQAEAANQSVIQMLPPSMAQAVTAKQAELTQQIKENVAAVSSFAPVAITENLVPASIEPLLQTVNTEAPLEAVANTLVQVALKPEDMEAFKAFLEQKSKE